MPGSTGGQGSNPQVYGRLGMANVSTRNGRASSP